MLDLGEIVYLDMPKTGSSTVVAFMTKCCNLRLSHFFPHEVVTSPIQADCSYFTTVRNPLDLYISLFRYGCEGLGGIRFRIEAQGRADLYVPDSAHFNEWLTFIMRPENAILLVNGLDRLHKHGIGLMSYRHFIYSRLNPEYWVTRLVKEGNLDQLYDAQTMVKLVIKCEELNEGLRHLAFDLFPDQFDLPRAQAFLDEDRRINASTVLSKDALEFESAILKELLKRERLLVERYYPELMTSA
jgi:hypothetical protein